LWVSLAAGQFFGPAEKPYLAALEEIGNGGGSLVGIAAATGYREDQITEGQLGPMHFV
jgi:hypothetical protein